MVIVIDLFNREVVGWSLKPCMTVDIVTDTQTMARFRRKPAEGMIHHLDRGSRYASHASQAKLKEYGMGLFNPDCPLGRHTGEGRYPAMKKIPRSGQNHIVVPLAWEIFDHLDSGLRRNDVDFSNELSGFNLKTAVSSKTNRTF